jgi:hypothetical protein
MIFSRLLKVDLLKNEGQPRRGATGTFFMPPRSYRLPRSPKKPMKSMLLVKSHVAEFVDDFGLVGNA